MTGFYQKKKLLPRWQIKIISLAILLALGILAKLDKPTTPPKEVSGNYSQYYATVTNVVDGDTIDIDVPDEINHKPFTRIRLRGVDTPETKHPKMPVQYFGPEATQFTKNFVLNKEVKVVLLENQTNHDKYGRLLAYIYQKNGKMLNKQLIIQGFGYADTYYKHPLKEEFIALGKKAKKEKIGLWLNIKPHQLPKYLQK